MKIYIQSFDEFQNMVKNDVIAIDEGKADTMSEDSLSFESLDKMREILTPARLELLRTIKREKPSSIYKLAKLVDRRPSNVNTDVNSLERMGLVELKKVKEGRTRVIPRVHYDKMTIEIAV